VYINTCKGHLIENGDFMKKLLTSIIAIAMAAAMFTGCTEGNEGTTTTTTTSSAEETTTPTMGTMKPVQEGDAYAVDKLEFGYMPEGWQVAGKLENAMVIISQENQIDIQGINYVEELNDLETFADSCMAVYRVNNMLYQSDVVIDEPYKMTVGKAGYEAIDYDFTIIVNEFIQDGEGGYVTDASGKQQSVEKARYAGKAVFFYSGADAYYMFFQCNEADYSRIEPKFNEFLAGIIVNEDAKASDFTSITTTAAADDTADDTTAAADAAADDTTAAPVE
jgi:hypothetical protein